MSALETRGWLRGASGRVWLATLCFLAACLVSGRAARAADYTWVGDVGGSFNVATNWSPNGIPGSALGDRAFFDDRYAVPGRVVVSAPPANALAQLWLVTNAPGAGWALEGQALSLAAGGASNVGSSTQNAVLCVGPAACTLDLPLRLATASPVATRFSVGSGASLIVAGPLSGAAAATEAQLVKVGAGSLRLSDGSTYGGATRIETGTLEIASDSALGAVPATATPGSIQMAGGTLLARASFTLNARRLMAVGPSTGSTGGTATISVAPGASVSYGGEGRPAGNGGTNTFSKAGEGALTLTGPLTTTGGILNVSIDGGEVTLAGAGSFASPSSPTDGSNVTANQGTRLTLDNAAGNANRLGDTKSLTLNGAEFVRTANGLTLEGAGPLIIGPGLSTITLPTDSSSSNDLIFSAFTRTVSAAAPGGSGQLLVRGRDLGLSADPLTANVAALRFVTPPNLTGGGGDFGTPTVSVLKGVVGDASPTGSGAGFVTYQRFGTGGGVRLLRAEEYRNNFPTDGSNANVRINLQQGEGNARPAAANALLLINSSGAARELNFSVFGATEQSLGAGILFSGNAPISVQSTAGQAPSNDNLTLTSSTLAGDGTNDLPLFSSCTGLVTVLTKVSSAGTSGTGSSTRKGGVAIGGVGAIRVSSSASGLSAGTDSVIAVNGPGRFELDSAIPQHSGFSVNGGTWRLLTASTGAPSPIAIASGATWDLNGFGPSVGSLMNGANGSGGLVTNSGALATLAVGNNNSSGTFSGTIAGALNLSKGGDGTQTLAGQSTYSGSTAINAGGIALGATNALPASTSLSIGNGASTSPSLDLNGFSLTVGSLTSGFSTGGAAAIRNRSVGSTSVFSVGSGTFAGGLFNGENVGGQFGVLAINKVGPGALRLSGAGIYTGLTRVAAGTLVLGASNALGFGDVLVAGGALDIGVYSDSVGALILRSGLVSGTTGTLSASRYEVQSGFVSAILGGSGSLSKTTEGTVTLSGASTYSGDTTVREGTLALGAADRIANASGLVLSGGTFSTGGFSETLGALSVTSNSNLSFGPGTNSTLRLASFGTSTGRLQVLDYDGRDRLFIGQSDAGASEAQEAQIDFIDPDNLASGTYDADQLASGEIVPVVPGVASSGALISEFRFRGEAGPADEYVEIYNATSAPLNVTGWSIRYNTASGVATVPVSTGATVLIPARGHLLFYGTGYRAGALDRYSAGDVAMVGDATNDSGVALRNAADPPATVDAAGFTSSPDGFKQGGLPAAPTENGQHAFVRDNSALRLKNTADNSTEFLFVSTEGGAFASTPHSSTGGSTLASTLGAPGPEGLSSAQQPLSGLVVGLLAGTNASAEPNQVRAQAGANPPASQLRGTLKLRRRVTNNTGLPISKLRFRAVRLTTLGSPGYSPSGSQADLRLLSSATESFRFNSTDYTVQGTRLEAPADAASGGGLNASVVEGTLELTTPLPAGETRDYAFLFGVAKAGSFSIVISAEGTPGS